MIRTIIVEDFEADRTRLQKILFKRFSNLIRVDGFATSIPEAIRLINDVKPDLVFLDIELPPYGTAFDLLSQIGMDQIRFGIIFTTQFEKYAVRAFEVSAICYLLKPINEEKLVGEFEKYQRYPVQSKLQIETAFKEYYQKQETPRLIILRDFQGNPIEVNPMNIVRLRADGNYCCYHLQQSSISTSLAPYTLSAALDTKLSDCSFFYRVHKSDAINLYHVVEFRHFGEEGSVHMSDMEIIKISRRKLADFKKYYRAFQR